MSDAVPPGFNAESVHRMSIAARNAIGDGWAKWVPDELARWADWFDAQAADAARARVEADSAGFPVPE